MQTQLKWIVALSSATAFTLGLQTIAPSQAQAAVITQTLPEFSFDGEPPFPNATQTVGTFNFSIPSGEEVVSAVINGTFGNSIVSNTAPVRVLLDNIQVAQCASSAEPCYSSSSPLPWSYTFNASQLGIFNDGSALLASIQDNEFITRLGPTQLQLTTRERAIPTPALLPGLIGMGLMQLRRRNKLNRASVEA